MIPDLNGESYEIELPYADYTYLVATDGVNTRLGKYVNGKIIYLKPFQFKIRDHHIQPKCMEQSMLLD